MKFGLRKTDQVDNPYSRIKIYCDGNLCKQNPLYFEEIKKLGWRSPLKPDTVYGWFEIGSLTQTFCSDCIDELYVQLKMTFNTRLWVFH